MNPLVSSARPWLADRGRLLLSAAVVGLGLVAAVHVPLTYLPKSTFSELSVELILDQPEELEALTRRFLVQVEEAIGSIGGVRAVSGWAHSRGASLRIRLVPGAAPSDKAARLDSELNMVRAILPERSFVRVTERGARLGGSDLILWIADTLNAAEVHRHARAIASLPEVRAVEVAGDTRPTLWILPHDPRHTLLLEQSVARALTRPRLGSAWIGGRRTQVERADALRSRPLEQMAVVLPTRTAAAPAVSSAVSRAVTRQPKSLGRSATLTLRSLASMTWQKEDPDWRFRVDGRGGRALLVERLSGIGELELRRALERYLEQHRLESRSRFVLDEAAPLRRLSGRVVGTLLGATMAVALVGAITLGTAAGIALALSLPVGAAFIVNSYLLLGLSLNVITLPLSLLALLFPLALQALRLADCGLRDANRRRRAVLSALLLIASASGVPIAALLAGGELAPVLTPSARIFLVSVVAAVLGSLLVPMPRLAPRGRWPAHTLKWQLRHSPTILLVAVTLSFASLVLFGDRLAPRRGQLAPVLSDLEIELRFAEGTGLSEAEERVAAVEHYVHDQPWARSQWSLYHQRAGVVRIEVTPERRRRADLERLARRLEMALSSVPALIRARAMAGGAAAGEPLRLVGDLEHRAETDEQATYLRVVLRSPRLLPLMQAREQILEAAGRRGVDPRQVRSEWGEPVRIIELRPLPLAGTSATDRLATQLRRLSAGDRRPLTGHADRSYRVIAPDAPARPGEVASLSELFGTWHGGDDLEPLVVARMAEVLSPPAIQRQQGRFVLPLDLALHWQARGQRAEVRSNLESAFARLTLPPGVDIELPERQQWQRGSERLELLRIASVLPLFLLVCAVCVLDSLILGTLQLLAPVCAVAGASLLLATGTSHADELTLLAGGGALCLVSAFSLGWCGRLSSATAPGVGPLYREATRLLPPTVPWLIGALALLVLPTLGLSSEHDAWVLPLRVAASVAWLGAVSTSLMTTPLLRLGPLLQRLRGPEARQRARPESWSRALGSPGGACIGVEQKVRATAEAGAGGTGPAESGERQPLLAARNLTKTYGTGAQAVRALSSVNFELEAGIVGLLGPNGAGKTTLLRLMCGLLTPTRGQIRFRGVPVKPANLARYRLHIGFLPQGFNGWEGFSSRDFLDYWALERGLGGTQARRREVDRVLERMGLTADAARPVRELSGGTRRRVGIARALLGGPPILIIDEPTTGLDVDSRRKLRHSLLQVASKRLVLFSTHIASDIATTAQRILILHRGRLLWDGPAAGLVASARGRVVETLVSDRELRELGRRELITARVRTADGIRVRMVLTPGSRPLPGQQRQPNIEEAYLALMLGVEDSSGLGATAALLREWLAL